MKLCSHSIKPLWQVVQDFSIGDKFSDCWSTGSNAAAQTQTSVTGSKEGSSEHSAGVQLLLTQWMPNPHQHINEQKKTPSKSSRICSGCSIRLTSEHYPLSIYHHSLHAILIPHHTSLEGQNLYFYILFKSSGLYNEYYQQNSSL